MENSDPAARVAALDHACTRRTTPLLDGEVVWRLWGSGPPLVLLHGGTGSWMHWIRNIEDLARDHLVVVPDIPGSGESASPAQPITAESIATILYRGLRTVIGGDRSFSIAGFSMGGVIAACIARQAGRTAERLVLVGSAGTGARRGEMEPLQSWRRLATEAERLAAHATNLRILMIHDPAKIDALAVHVQSQNAGRARVRGKHVSATITLPTVLPGCTARIAGIWGEHDATSAPYLGERRDMIRRVQPDAPFEVIPGAGHWVQYEAAEEFNARLRAVCQAILPVA